MGLQLFPGCPFLPSFPGNPRSPFPKGFLWNGSHGAAVICSPGIPGLEGIQDGPVGCRRGAGPGLIPLFWPQIPRQSSDVVWIRNCSSALSPSKGIPSKFPAKGPKNSQAIPTKFPTNSRPIPSKPCPAQP